MIWAHKTAAGGSSEATQRLFEECFIRAGGPREMLLAASDDRMIISVPDVQTLAQFGGFSAISEADLPKTAVLLVGDQDAFDERFNR